MNNKILISLIVSTFFLLGGANSVFASYDPNYAQSIAPYYYSGNGNFYWWYSQITIPAEQIVDHCVDNSNHNGIALRLQKPDSSFLVGYLAGGDWTAGSASSCSAIASAGSWTNTNFAINIATPDFSAYYPVSGQYNFVFVANDNSNYPYLTVPVYVDKNEWTMSAVSLSTDGVCGSANGGSYSGLTELSPVQFCSSGTEDSFYFDGLNGLYSWYCIGSGGGSNSGMCAADYLIPTSAQCGTMNGQISTTEPYDSQACLSGTITGMTQAEDDSWSWSCAGSEEGDEVSCSTIASSPTIPDTLPSDDSIECDISPTDLSTIGDCLGSVAKWLFLPHQGTLDALFALRSEFYSKSPFGYISAFKDEISSLSGYTSDDLVLNLSFQEQTVSVFDISELKTQFASFFTFIFQFLRAVLWIGFLLWAYNLGRSLFGNKKE